MSDVDRRPVTPDSESVAGGRSSRRVEPDEVPRDQHGGGRMDRGGEPVEGEAVDLAAARARDDEAIRAAPGELDQDDRVVRVRIRIRARTRLRVAVDEDEVRDDGQRGGNRDRM